MTNGPVQSVIDMHQALMQISALVADLFDVPVHQATGLVRRFCIAKSVSPEILGELLSPGVIALHPAGLLTAGLRFSSLWTG